jgi:hypothetical protein
MRCKLVDPFGIGTRLGQFVSYNWHNTPNVSMNLLEKNHVTLCFRGWSEIATFHWVRLAGLPCFKSRLQTCSIRTGISARGVGWGTSPGGRTRRSSGWFHGLNTASRLHRIQVLALLANISLIITKFTLLLVRLCAIAIASLVESELDVMYESNANAIDSFSRESDLLIRKLARSGYRKIKGEYASINVVQS